MPALPPADEKRPLGIYLHWPFCEAICPYCDFNVARGRHVDDHAWTDAFLAELAHMRSKAVNHVVESIYFGGGTPSLMTPANVRRLIDHIKSLWDVRDDCEVSLEANPTHGETGRFAALAEAGRHAVVSRCSGPERQGPQAAGALALQRRRPARFRQGASAF